MSTNKTPHLNLHSWVETDYVDFNEWNDNFTQLDTELFNALTVLESVRKTGVVSSKTAPTSTDTLWLDTSTTPPTLKMHQASTNKWVTALRQTAKELPFANVLASLTSKNVEDAINELAKGKVDDILIDNLGMSDLNTSFTKTGFYYVANATNTPPNANDDGFVLHFDRGVYVAQLYITSQNKEEVYVRRKVNGTWQPWRSFILNGDFAIGGRTPNISSTDLNALMGKGTGFFAGENLTNAPSAYHYYVRHIDFHTAGYAHQTLMRSAHDHHYEQYYRVCIAGQWKPWVSMLTGQALAVQPNGRVTDLGSLGATDIDTLNVTGFYGGSQILNRPPNGTSIGYVFHMEYRVDGYACQIYMNGQNTPEQFIRFKNQHVWTEWVSVGSGAFNGLFETGIQIKAKNTHISFLDSAGTRKFHAEYSETNGQFSLVETGVTTVLTYKPSTKTLTLGGSDTVVQMSGRLVFTAGSNWTTTGASISLKNANIDGLNALIFNDENDASGEGILFPKTGKGGSKVFADYDAIYALDGKLFLNKNEVLHKGNTNANAVSSFKVGTTRVSVLNSKAWEKFEFNDKTSKAYFYDNLNEFSVTTNRFTAKEDGIYLFTVNIGGLELSQGTDFRISIRSYYKGGVAGHYADVVRNKVYYTDTYDLNGTTQVKLSAGDYVEVYYYMSSNGNHTSSSEGYDTFFTGTKLV